MTPEEYINKVYLWLMEMFTAGAIPAESIDSMMQSAIIRVKKEGVHPGLSFHREITQGIPFLQTEVGKEYVKPSPARIGAEFEREQQRIVAEGGAFRKAKPIEGEMKPWERVPTPEYRVPFEQVGEEIKAPKTETWRSWFSSQYPELLREFQATVPRFEEKFWRETISDWYGHGENLEPWEYQRQMPVEEVESKVEQSWVEYLKKKKPKLRERWYGMSPWERGERPSVYAPGIRTVGF